MSEWTWTHDDDEADSGVAVYFIGTQGFRLPLPNFKTAQVIGQMLDANAETARRSEYSRVKARIIQELEQP